jgi:hypothetical protein
MRNRRNRRKNRSRKQPVSHNITKKDENNEINEK